MKDSSAPQSLGHRRWLLVLTPSIAVLRVRDFRGFWLSGAAGDITMNLWFLTTSWLMLEATDSALWVGLIGGAAGLSGMVLAVGGGTLADRLDRRNALVGSRAGYLAIVLATALLAALGVLVPWALVLLAGLIGVVWALDAPLSRAMVADLVGNDRLLAANALGAVKEYSGEVLVPLVAGFSIATLGGTGTLWFAVAGAVLAVAFATGIQSRGRISTRRAGSMLREIREGIAYARKTPPIPALLAIIAASLFWGAMSPLLPVYARDVLKAGPAGFGVLAAALGLGLLFGALLTAMRGDFQTRSRAMLLSSGVVAAAMIGFAFSRIFAVSVAFVFLVGVAMSVSHMLATTMLQASAPPDFRGRVMSLHAIADALTPVGAVLGGALAVLIGGEAALSVAALAGASVVIAAYWRSRALRRT